MLTTISAYQNERGPLRLRLSTPGFGPSTSYWEKALERLHLSTGLGDVSLEEEGPEGSLGFLLHPRSNFKISGSGWMIYQYLGLFGSIFGIF